MPILHHEPICAHDDPSQHSPETSNSSLSLTITASLFNAMKNQQSFFFTAILWLCSLSWTCSAFSPSLLDHHRPGFFHIPKPSALALTTIKFNYNNDRSEKISTTPTYNGINENDDNNNCRSTIQTRREWTSNMFKSMIATSTISFINCFSAESAHAAEVKEPTIWKTGRAPEIPGQKPKDKGDVKGTKKDPSFLRSVADCKNKCENSYGPDGRGKTSAECLSECQDICCTTYEQCTFAIVPR